jgi:hypothetical protein
MSNTIYLYLKTHNKTGLQYLGKTAENPYAYNGSGKYWKRHLSVHGDDITTTILFESDDPEKIKQMGLHYSDLWDVVNSEKFANLKPESGDGGSNKSLYTEEVRSKISQGRKKWLSENVNPHLGMKRSEETRRKIGGKSKGRQTTLGKPCSEETRLKIGNGNRGKTRTPEERKRMSESRVGRTHSDETKQLLSKIHSGKKMNYKLTSCPKCSKIGRGPNMTRYHFENCKELL